MATLTAIHVVISLAGIVSGFVVIFGLLGGKQLDRWTAFFLTTTVLTSVTGYFFPVHKLMPSHIVGALSLVALGFAIFARYNRNLTGRWRATYVVTAIVAQYFNVFVLVVQSFLKIPSLKALAPTQSEPPFEIAQGLVLVLFVVLGTLAVKRFRVESAAVVAAASR
ncbi:MAG TPA: hypothetical protein VG498_11105 [Terriglobales bacterium]|nr:hypothetical protein [Terriglobales bacterium]